MQSIQTAQPLIASYRPTVFRVRMCKALLRLILIVVSIAAGLVVCEMMMRAFQLGNTRVVTLYNNRILKLPPHFGLINYYENKNFVETNNLGFHDHERQATNDNYRILFLGDSFLEGRQVETDSLFTIRLEEKFSQQARRIETINGGVSGTGTAYQYVLWKEFFEPNIKVDHLVLCFFMGNDLVDNNLDLTYSTFGGSDNPFFVDRQGSILDTGTKPGELKKSINLVRNHSVLINTLYEYAYQLKRTLQEESAVKGGSKGGRVDQSGAWQASELGTIALIERWKSELASKSMPFDVVVIDRPGKVYNKFELEFIDKLQASCAQDHIDYLRLRLTDDPYESYSLDGINLGHFNHKGHELAANELYDYFRTHHPAIFDRK
jgi:lysophospholipase L1-like esterase